MSATDGALIRRAYAMLWQSLFGAVWILIGVATIRRPAPLFATGIAALLAVALIGSSFRALRQARARALSVAPDENARRTSRLYRLIVAVEFALIGAAAFILGSFRLPQLILPAVAIIVGLHFVPLARLFRASGMYWVAACITAGAALSLVLLPERIASPLTCLFTGLVLWIRTLALLWGFESDLSASPPSQRLA